MVHESFSQISIGIYCENKAIYPKLKSFQSPYGNSRFVNYSLFIKKSVSYPVYYINNIFRRFVDNKDVLILMYHRILNRNTHDGLLQDAMYVNYDTFERHIDYVRKKYNLVSLETICNLPDKKVHKKTNKPLCCITFDDGWKDFYDYAFPVMKKYNAYGTVFLPTNYIGTNKQLWTELLADIIICIKNKGLIQKQFNVTGNLFIDIENIGGPIGQWYEDAILRLKAIPMEEIYNILWRLADKWKIDINCPRRSFLSWEEVKEIRDSGIMSFGSHTHNHKILTTLCEDAIRDELMVSKNILIDKGVVSETFIPFAYPNGNHTERIAKLVEEAGYSLAVTTLRGWNRITCDEKNIYRLNRVGIHEDITSTNSMFACRVHGYL
jgi:peptidoglycan/xylan/chitin deacetylase (PgdA/CDA1 family)